MYEKQQTNIVWCISIKCFQAYTIHNEYLKTPNISTSLHKQAYIFVLKSITYLYFSRLQWSGNLFQPVILDGKASYVG